MAFKKIYIPLWHSHADGADCCTDSMGGNIFLYIKKDVYFASCLWRFETSQLSNSVENKATVGVRGDM